MTAVFRLSAVDALFSLSNHPLVHFFENKAQAGNFMPAAKLKDALYYALESFPVLTGHIRKAADGSGMAIIVDENNPNPPGFIETSSSVHFNSCSEAVFNWKKWPRNVASTGFVTAPGKEGTIKLLNVHVVRLKDNSGLILFCNIPHYVLDGFGYYEFLCHWALLCRECDSQQARNVSGTAPTRPFTFDRLLFRRNLRGQRRPLDSETQKFLTNKTCISSLFAKLPYKLQTRLASTASRVIRANAHYFHVSNAALEELYSLYRSKHESNVDLDSSSLSSCAVLTSLFCTSIIQVHIDQRKHRNILLQKSISALGSIFSSTTDTFMLVNCIHAHRLVKMNNCQYVGNPMFMQLAFGLLDYSHGNNAASVFADAVYNIYTKTRDVDPSLLGELYDMLEANTTVYAKLATDIAMGRPLLTFIDEREYRIGDVDFGWGSPSWVSALPWNMPNFVAFFANQQSSGGVFVYASLRDKILRNMLKSEFFTRYTQLLY